MFYHNIVTDETTWVLPEIRGGDGSLWEPLKDKDGILERSKFCELWIRMIHVIQNIYVG